MHAPFIRDAIEGFLMQQTTFPVEILIHDDASPDGTAEIVREYEKKHPQLIKATYQIENQHKKKPKTDKYIKPHPRRGKYVAMCEGDDYWTDPMKLQKQVEFMEANPDFSMCFHAVELVDGHKKTGKIAGAGKTNKAFDQDKLFYSGGFHSPTASLLYKKDYVLDRPLWSKSGPVGDVPLKLLLFLKGKIYYMHETMGVRRINVPGSWNQRVRKVPEQEYKYHLGMIKMLDGFNLYSNYKYDNEVSDKQLFFTKKTFFFIPQKDRQEVMQDKRLKQALNRLSFLRKAEFYAVLYFPKLFDKNGVIRRFIGGKKPYFYKPNNM